MDLCDNRLKELPPELSKLTALKDLNLQANRLSGPLSSSIGCLTSLTKLGFHGNSITELPDSLGQLVELTELTVSHNSLTGELTEAIGKLVKLTQLDLGNNQLESLPECIGNLIELSVRETLRLKYALIVTPQTVHISGNQITSLPDSIGNWEKLNSLFIYDNRLTELPRSIQRLTQVNLLNASQNRLQTVPWRLHLNKRFICDRNDFEASIPSEEQHGDTVCLPFSPTVWLILSFRWFR